MLVRGLYSLLLYLCLPAVFGYFAWRGLREPGYWHGWGERFGFGDITARGGIWLHAASVGEVQAAVPVVRALAEHYPDCPLLVTVFTPTGRERAREALADIAQVRYLPLDLPGAVNRFLHRAAPRAGLIVETEIWPNLLATCARLTVPVMFVNGRLSERSAQRYARAPLRPLIVGALGSVKRVAAAGPEDARRFIALGVPASCVIDTGNLKFDLDLPGSVADDGRALRRSWNADDRAVWVAASTHAGEEEAVLDAFVRLREHHPALLLVLVPRHPQRFDTVAGLLDKRGMPFARRSRGQAVDAKTPVLLGDTLGELLTFYAAADLTFVGGSLAAGIGGHNLLEPAALRLPIVVGPHLGGWTAVADWLQEAGALHRVSDVAVMAEAVSGYLDDARARRTAGLAAERVVKTHSGALERTLRLLPELLTPVHPD